MGMRRAYILPSFEGELNNRLFENEGNDYQVWCFVRSFLEQKGFTLATADLWQSEEKHLDDTLIVLGHPEAGLFRRLNYAFKRRFFHKDPFALKYYRYRQFINQFPKRILIQSEPSAVTPFFYKNLSTLRSWYAKIYLASRSQEDGFHFRPHIFENVFEPYFSNQDRKFLALMNGNKKPGDFTNELYSERLRAIAYFSKRGELELYGAGWNRPIYFPYWRYRKYARQSYRGYVENKYETLSHYTFAICYENAILPGWITEKMLDCFVSGTIPIYYGDPEVTKIIPKECFIDLRDFETYDQLESFLKSRTPADLEAYRIAIKQWYAVKGNKVFTKEYFARFLSEAIL